MTDKATLQKLFEAAMRGNADFPGKPLQRAFPESKTSQASPPQSRFAEKPRTTATAQPVRAED
jgi:hypothetical protein